MSYWYLDNASAMADLNKLAETAQSEAQMLDGLDRIKKKHIDDDIMNGAAKMFTAVHKNTGTSEAVFKNADFPGKAKILSQDVRLSSAYTIADPTLFTVEQFAAMEHHSYPDRHLMMIYEVRTHLVTDQKQEAILVDYIDYCPSLNVCRWARPSFDVDAYSSFHPPVILISQTGKKMGMWDGPVELNSFHNDTRRKLLGVETMVWLQQIRQHKAKPADYLPSIKATKLDDQPDTVIALGHNEFLLLKSSFSLSKTGFHNIYEKPDADRLTLLRTTKEQLYVIVDHKNTIERRSEPGEYNGIGQRNVYASKDLSKLMNHPEIQKNRASRAMVNELKNPTAKKSSGFFASLGA